jgi:hypothetical protein
VQANPLVQLYAQGFITPQGARKVLLVNKRDRALEVLLAGAKGGVEQRVDAATRAPPLAHTVTVDTVHLPPSAVTVVTLPH